MEVDYRMQQFAAVVAFAASGGTCDVALLIDERKHLLIVIVIHKRYQGINNDESP